MVYGNQVSDNTYTGTDPGQASGVILFRDPTDTGSVNLLEALNTTERNDTNIGLYNIDNIRVSGDTANDATFYDGLYADADSAGNLFDNNQASNNGNPADTIDLGGHDCHDDSTGSGTAGTANAWVNDQGQKATPPGICNPTQQPGSTMTESTNSGAERTDAQRQKSGSPMS